MKLWCTVQTLCSYVQWLPWIHKGTVPNLHSFPCEHISTRMGVFVLCVGGEGEDSTAVQSCVEVLYLQNEDR